MMMKDFQPLHNSSSIASGKSLAKHLGIDWSLLKTVSENIQLHWKPGKSKTKPNGSVRITHSGSDELKAIHLSINRKILSKVSYPRYLHGGIKNNSDGSSRNHIANAKLHQGKRLIISADISGFFPSVSESIIENIWHCFFPYTREVASLLTRLTSYKGELPQGWGNSPYLAQLVFWDIEYLLYEKYLSQNIKYTRYIDDFTLSTDQTLTKDELTQIFRDLAVLCMKKGTKLKGKKCKVESRARRQTVNKLGVNSSKISLSPAYRKTLRARIHQFILNKPKIGSIELSSQKRSIQGQINYLRKFHPIQAGKLEVMLRN